MIPNRNPIFKMEKFIWNTRTMIENVDNFGNSLETDTRVFGGEAAPRPKLVGAGLAASRRRRRRRRGVAVAVAELFDDHRRVVWKWRQPRNTSDTWPSSLYICYRFISLVIESSMSESLIEHISNEIDWFVSSQNRNIFEFRSISWSKQFLRSTVSFFIVFQFQVVYRLRLGGAASPVRPTAGPTLRWRRSSRPGGRWRPLLR